MDIADNPTHYWTYMRNSFFFHWQFRRIMPMNWKKCRLVFIKKRIV